jgi:CheY-like chemotaxis protein
VQKRVLIVDDSKFVRTTFKHILSSSFAVREEADGEAAWQAIKTDPSIVIIFSDLDMPKLDGYGLIERIRKSAEARIRELPVKAKKRSAVRARWARTTSSPSRPTRRRCYHA